MTEIERIKEKLDLIKLEKELLTKQKEKIEMELKKRGYSIKRVKGYTYVYQYNKKEKKWNYVGPTYKVLKYMEEQREKKAYTLTIELEKIQEQLEYINNRIYEIEETINKIINTKYKKSIKEIIDN